MNSNITLFVLAAGMGSRYGGLKQMESFGPNGETIIDYSIHDAIQAGFSKIVFVIRPDMEEPFKEIFMSKYENKIDITYTFQSLNMVPDWYKVDPNREKPWGTVHAVLVAKEVINEPFLIINGDDFYGKEAFQIAAKFLKEKCAEKTYANVLYKLKNVLSDYGTVKRGVCTVDKDNNVQEIVETFDIKRNQDNSITGNTWDGKPVTLNDNDLISMNMFAVHNSVFNHLEEYFNNFLKEDNGDLKREALLPIALNNYIEKDKIEMKSVECNAKWFGVTVKEDAPIVREKLNELVEEGIYKSPLE